ncbi:hypothetical protein D9615_010463 [Tricholomella constricta]|uniref:Uncharacterized protein n=1 Tax=Tricholomella constricta TaxID=117010 RepID=A0A8H5GLJ4_9AGAR|nr:hypothetical protein D9615_010463 [Tricholomella constricta]
MYTHDIVLFPAPPPTTNALSPGQRTRLLRSSKKLGRILGTTPHFVDAVPDDDKSFCSSSSASSSSRASIDSAPAPAHHPRLTRKPPMLRLALGPCPSPPSSDSPSPTDISFTIPTPANARRRKMDRLRRTLGDDVPLRLVFPSPSDESSDESLPSPTPPDPESQTQTAPARHVAPDSLILLSAPAVPQASRPAPPPPPGSPPRSSSRSTKPKAKTKKSVLRKPAPLPTVHDSKPNYKPGRRLFRLGPHPPVSHHRSGSGSGSALGVILEEACPAESARFRSDNVNDNSDDDASASEEELEQASSEDDFELVDKEPVNALFQYPGSSYVERAWTAYGYGYGSGRVGSGGHARCGVGV